MQCSHCQIEINTGAKFCTHCGTPLPQEPIQTTRPETPVNPAWRSNGLVLPSPAPFPDKMTQYNIAYIIITVPLAILGIIGGMFWEAMFIAAFFNGFWYLLQKHFIARGKVVACGLKKYAFPAELSTQDISARIVRLLAQMHMTIEVRDSQISVYHDKVEHIVIFDDSKGTFIVQTHRAFSATKLFLGTNYSKSYRYAMTDVPLIVYTIQQEI